MAQARDEVFVSYRRADTPGSSGRLHDTLAQAFGNGVFQDTTGIGPGDRFPDELQNHLDRAAMVLVVIGPHWLTADDEYGRRRLDQPGDWVAHEVATALKASGVMVVPVLVDGAERPPGAGLPDQLQELATRQAVSLDHARWAETIGPLLERISSTLGIPLGGAAGSDADLPESAFSPLVPRVDHRWFVGREHVLAQLDELDSAAGAAVVTQAVAGLGGVGKTTVAAAYAESRRDDVEIVWWVRAEDSSTLVEDLAGLGSRVGLPGGEGEVSERAVAVRDWLEATKRSWLVVFDNVTDEASIGDWVPKRGNGLVLITTRNQNMHRLGAVLDLDVFDTPTAVGFLATRVAQSDPAAAADSEAISAAAERAQGLPLALEQAAAWVERTPRRGYGDWVELFDDARQSAFPDASRPLDRDSTAETTWKVSIDAAARDAPVAEALMAVLGHVAPTPLPIAWMTDAADDLYLDATVEEIGEGLDALHGYSLINLDADTVSVHRVVQYAARRTTSADVAACVIRILRRQAPGEAGDHRSWPNLAMLAPHAIHVVATATAALPDSAHDLWWLLDDIATYQTRSGNVAAAIATAHLALTIAERHLDADHPDTLNSRHQLAATYETAGRLDDAIPLFEATLDDRQRVLGHDHPHTLATRHYLAFAYQSAGRLDDAIPLFEATLADRQRVEGHDHPHTLANRNHLALAYVSAGRLDEAIALFAATLADEERLQGHDHPDTLAIRHNLAYAYMSAGRLDDAIPLHEATLADRQRVLGTDHPDTLASRSHLADAYAAAGRLDDAILLHEATLADRQRVLGDDHPHTLSSLEHLAIAYWEAGQAAEAIAAMEQAVETATDVLGTDHPLRSQLTETLDSLLRGQETRSD